MIRQLPYSITLFFTLASCSDTGNNPIAAQSNGQNAGSDKWKEGTDYTVMERVRFMDEQGFQQPAEAFSVLLPKGWSHEGGIRWGSTQGCRGELVTANWTVASPDGAIRYVSLPLHAWGSSSDPMMMQAMQMQAQNGGCEVGGPMSAEQYLRQVLAPQHLNGASITEVRENIDVQREMDQNAGRMKARAEQNGGHVELRNSAIIARLRWNDGTEGIAFSTVLNMITTMQDMYSGAMQQFTTSIAGERSYLRYPAARRDEAEQLVVNMRASYHTNPAWRSAVDDFYARMNAQQNTIHRERIAAIDQQTQANTAAHNQRMGDIQRQGDANTAAYQQRMAGMDRNMRSWEAQQSGQDRMHSTFVKAIREVETYQDGAGQVELSSGYDQAWSRGDGTYILSNKPGFDPSAVFQDQSWQEMKRTD